MFAERRRGIKRLAAGAASLVLTAVVMAGCGGAGGGKAAVARVHGVQGGTVTFAAYTGEDPSYLFPLFGTAFWDIGYIPWGSYLMWRPLYLWGKDGRTEFNPQRSLAFPPQFSLDAAGHTVATITLKARRWSDGRPITTRDVEFWMNLLKVEKDNFGPYVPGKFPDNVEHISYISPRRFVVTFNSRYDLQWVLGNELTQITPIPQHAWDRTSARGPVGNYDRTPAGAKAVYKFLEGEATKPSTFSANPLWKVVDGPWEIKSYDVTSGRLTLVPDPRYPWPEPYKLSQFVEIPFTSDAAELDALESGDLSVGYVPLSSLKVLPRLRAMGYKITYWQQDSRGGVILQYAKDDPSTPIFSQLYVRQALAHLVDVHGLLHVIEHRLGSYVSGPVPNPAGHGQYVTGVERRDPYPYSVSAAVSLLRRHGWHVVPGGVTTCARPGSGPGECGSGVRKGARMSFTMIGTAEPTMNAQINEALKSSFSQAGIDLNVHTVPAGGLIGAIGNCIRKTHCSYDMAVDVNLWPIGWPGYFPSDGGEFECGAGGDNANLCNPTIQRLDQVVRTNPDTAKAIGQWEDFMAKEQFQLSLPVPVFRVVAYKAGLQGVTPLDPYLGLYPEDWYYSRR
jgi:peptide/nickel transport system substrate-binding protein